MPVLNICTGTERVGVADQPDDRMDGPRCRDQGGRRAAAEAFREAQEKRVLQQGLSACLFIKQ